MPQPENTQCGKCSSKSTCSKKEKDVTIKGKVTKKADVKEEKTPLVFIACPNNSGFRNESCYSEDTEILTEDGWKFFKNLEKNEKVITLNPETNEMEYYKPMNYYKYNGSRQMFHQSGKNIDLLVTMQHGLWVGVQDGRKGFGRWEFRNPKELPRYYQIKRNGIWNKEDKELFIIPKISDNEKRIKYRQERSFWMDDWLRFFGLWLAEGSCYKNSSGYYVTIAQSEQHVLQRKVIEEAFSGIGLHCWYDGKEYKSKDKQLWNHLKQFGHAKDKYIPRELLQLSKRQLEILFKSMLIGDGCLSNRDSKYRNYATISKQLKNNVQEILLKIGLAGTVIDKGVEISYVQLTPTLNRTDNRESVQYDGNVYDVEVPNHIIYVRRNGKACWSGNSCNAMMGMGWFLGASGIQAASYTFDEHPISKARNMAVEAFLAAKQFTHLFFIDSDTVPKSDIIIRLLKYDLPVVSGWYLSRSGSGLPVVLKITGDTPATLNSIKLNPDKFPEYRAFKLTELLSAPKEKNGLIKVDGVGAGALLIKREALSHLSKPYFFEDPINPKGFGEDLYFGLNCKVNNIPIYVDLNAFCEHFGWGLIGMRHVKAIIQMEQRKRQQQVGQPEKPPM